MPSTGGEETPEASEQAAQDPEDPATEEAPAGEGEAGAGPVRAGPDQPGPAGPKGQGVIATAKDCQDRPAEGPPKDHFKCQPF